MTFAGLKKWWPITCAGRPLDCANSSMSSVDVFDASTASGRVTRASSANVALLQVHVLEHGLDDDVDLVEAVVARRRRDEAQRSGHRLRRHLALRDRGLVVLPDRRHAAIDGGLIDVLQQHRDAGIGVRHRDAAAHRAGADDRRARDVLRRRVLRDVRNLRDLALGEEQMPQRPRFVGEDAVGEELALALGSGLEVHA